MSFLDFMQKNYPGNPFTWKEIMRHGPEYLNVSEETFCELIGVTKRVRQKIIWGSSRLPVSLVPRVCVLLKISRQYVEAIYLTELRVEIRRMFDLNIDYSDPNFEANIIAFKKQNGLTEKAKHC